MINIINIIVKYFVFIFLITLTSLSQAKINVVTTIPDLAWAAQRIGGDRVNVTSLLEGTEDVHYVDAMPHWIAIASKADIFCMVGLELEVGWVPRILSRSGNAKIQQGGAGYCDVGKNVKALEVPKGNIDRSMGDIHSGGNPHYNLGPSFYLQGISEILDKLMALDPSGAGTYLKNFKLLNKEITALKNEVYTMLKPLQNKKLMSYHKEFSYFLKDFDLKSIGEIEENPGVPPSAGRIASVALKAKKESVYTVIASSSNPNKILRRFSEIADIPIITVPTSIRTKGRPGGYRELLMDIAKALLNRHKK